MNNRIYEYLRVYYSSLIIYTIMVHVIVIPLYNCLMLHNFIFRFKARLILKGEFTRDVNHDLVNCDSPAWFQKASRKS